MTLKNSGSGLVKVLSVDSDSPNVTASFSALEEGKSYAIKVRVPKSVRGIVRGRVTVRTDHRDAMQAELKLPVYAIISKKGES